MKPELVSSIFTLICFLPFTFAQEQDEENTIPSEITESFHPWSYAPICTEPLKALGGPLCVYTNATFANGRGISIFTTPKISESFAAEIPFHDDNVLAEHGINDPHGDEARPWYVADLAGKGKGVLAKHELRRGDRITAYTPYILVHMESEFTVDEREKWLKMAIRQLPEASQEHFFSLATIWNEKGYEAQDVIKANAFEMQVGGVMHVGVFPETSRLNHACSPNAQYFLEPGLLTHFVHASRDIAPDEEITVSYAPPLRFHETRQKYLKDHFHFTCDCPRCQNGLASDDALHQIDTLQSSLGNWTPESTASVKKAEELIRLYKQEGLEGFLDTAYGYAALTYNAVGSVRGAKRYAKLAAESAALKYGPSYKDIATWKDLENDPQGHYSHLVLPKQHAFRRAFGTFPDHARRYLISEGRTTSPPDERPPPQPSTSSSPFYLETGYSIFAKRPSRPFPPPFVSAPSGSFSDPLTTHNAPRGRRPYVNGQLVRGITNGDDAIIIGDANFIAVDDGVGAWALKERGHAALWSRLIAHFWAVEVEKSFTTKDGAPVKLDDLNPIQNLQDAYEQTKAATKGTLKDEPDPLSSSSSDSSSESSQKGTKDEKHEKDTDKDKDKDKEKPGENDILGTTTASSALLYHTSATPPVPVILATTLGDCKVLILRPSFARNSTQESKSSSSGNSNGGGGSGVAATKPKSTTPEEEVDFSKCILYRSTEQWHWFDCPRQLGTNSPDTPVGNGVCDTVEVSPGDVVAVLSDGVTDNLWEHEIAETICTCVQKWEAGVDEAKDGIVYVARTLMNAAREVAQDPNAESPYMERAFDEGIAAEGGKLDDISVVLGLCRKREDE